MHATRRPLIVTAGALLAAAVVILPASAGSAAERTPVLSYDLTGLAPAAAPLPQVAAVPDEDSVTCLAKVVHHEARNQPRSGQVAVAQTLVNRLRAGGRFGNTICQVANQRGQYFQTAGYRPRDDESWESAVDVAQDTLSGQESDIVPGAMFFRAAYAAPSGFFRSRQRVAAVGDHVFYR